MTTRNLDALFHPRAIALVGASNQPGSVGQVLARNLLEGGFAGPVMPVNPHAAAVRSALAYPDIASLPVTPDLAVIATPAAATPSLVSQLGARGCRAAVVISAGFEGAEAACLRTALLEAARPHLLRVVGPNCLGVISPAVGLNASFAHLTPRAGGLALVSQSGAIAAAALDWAAARGLGFSHLITLGDALDVDAGDVLDYLALDPATKAILLYVESVTDARKFMSAGRIAARTKPVIVLKAGRSAAGAQAAFSHTGALAGADLVYDAAFRRAGMLRVTELGELFEAAATVGSGQALRGEGLAILTNGGGAGVMAADALETCGGELAALTPQTLAAIDALASRHWSHRNPVDLAGDVQPPAFAAALDILLAAPEAAAVLVMTCPTAVTDSTEVAVLVVQAAARHPGKPLVAAWLGEATVQAGRQVLAAAGIPTPPTPNEGVRAFMHLVTHRRNQQQLLRAPGAPAADTDVTAARALVDAAMAAGRTTLTDPEARELLRAYGVPVIDSLTATDPAGAGRAAAALGERVALKVLSRAISHKSDVGGVALDLAGPAEVATVATVMLARVRALRPDAQVDGFLVEPMVPRTGQELLVGLAQDPTFGPVVLFGQGGTATEVIPDRAVALPPLDDALARDLIQRTRVARLLAGFRDQPPADLDALCAVLVAVGRIAADLPEVAELDINPLRVDAAGVLALDARIALRPADTAPRPAILPCPSGLAHDVTLAHEPLHIRPIRPDDAAGVAAMVALSAPEDVRFRFGGALRGLSPELALRLSQIDYDRQMALVAETTGGDIVAVGRVMFDPEGETADLTLMVRSDRQDRGLGRYLLDRLLKHAGARGAHKVWSDMTPDNGRMIRLCEAFGFTRAAAGEPGEVRMVKALSAGRGVPPPTQTDH